MFYSADYTIGCMDVDVNDNIKPTDLVKCINETANRQMHDRRPSYIELFTEGKSFIITRLSLEIYAQVHQFDTITVRTWTAGERGATFYRGYQVMRGNECVALGLGEWAVVDVNDGHIYRTSEIDLSNYESGEKPELSLNTRFRFPAEVKEALSGEAAAVHKVVLSECDMNMHMNNTQYHNMLWNNIGDVINKEVTSINIRYRTEAALGTDIEIHEVMLPKDGCDPGDTRADEICAFRTEVDGKTNVEALIGVKAFR